MPTYVVVTVRRFTADRPNPSASCVTLQAADKIRGGLYNVDRGAAEICLKEIVGASLNCLDFAMCTSSS